MGSNLYLGLDLGVEVLIQGRVSSPNRSRVSSQDRGKSHTGVFLGRFSRSGLNSISNIEVDFLVRNYFPIKYFLLTL